MAASGLILIVDDAASVLDALRAALDPYYDVLTTRTGLGALELIARQAPDLVLLDYVLPDVSGLSLLRTIKRLFPSVLVIIMSGFGSEAVSLESFRGGARDYLKKPISLPYLVSRIERLLAARQGCAEQRTPVLLPVKAALPDGTREARAGNLQRALAFIENQLGAHLTLDQVSREAGMSKFYFCRSFKTFMGLTFREYLARRRIARAVELLRDRDYSVTRVCLEVGFKDMTHFGRVFRKITGQLPSIYRRAPVEPPPRAMPTPTQRIAGGRP